MTHAEAVIGATAAAVLAGGPIPVYRHRMDGRYIMVLTDAPKSANWELYSRVTAAGEETLLNPPPPPPPPPEPAPLPATPAVFPSTLDTDIASIKDGIDIIRNEFE